MHRPVSLPMYAAPDAVLDAFWIGLRRHLIEAGLDRVPERLSMPERLETHWLDPDLLLSQTCGFPLTDRLAGHVAYVGTPHYAAVGCTGPNYSSAVVVRADAVATGLGDLRGRCVAFNSRDSQSGYNSLRALAAPLARHGRLFAGVVETGSHRASIAAVRSGEADLAAVDAVTLALLQRDQPEEWSGLRVLTYTESAPGLPFITAARTTAADLDRLRQALHATFANPGLAQVRATLLLDGFTVLPEEAYGIIPAMHARASALGYPTLD